jgi:hypothetical protein
VSPSMHALSLIACTALVQAHRHEPPRWGPEDSDALTLISRDSVLPKERPAARVGSGVPRAQDDLEAIAIGNVLDRFHHAAARADFNDYFAAWTEESVFLGTDATERWVGNQFKEFARPHFANTKGWAYRPHGRHISVLKDGMHACFDELLDNDKLGLCRGSGVLAKQGGEWKILQYNLSIPVPNDLAAGVVEAIRKAPAARRPEKDPERHKE